VILIIDNYDSFTYNLYQYIGEIYRNIKVVRNDEIIEEELTDMKLEGIILSPGPGVP
jgi:anthranilate synthase component 2